MPVGEAVNDARAVVSETPAVWDIIFAIFAVRY
jgi:hypothetical protein